MRALCVVLAIPFGFIVGAALGGTIASFLLCRSTYDDLCGFAVIIYGALPSALVGSVVFPVFEALSARGVRQDR